LAIPVDADHLSIAKPANRDELVFKRIKAFIEERLPTTPLAPTLQSPSWHSRRFFLSYRRNAKEDAGLAQLLYQELRKAGHDVFIDVQMTIGTDWARRIEERIDWCEFLVVMLSAESINSEMVQEEVRLAHQRRKRNGTPFILPIRVRYDGPLGYALGAYIERYRISPDPGSVQDGDLGARTAGAMDRDRASSSQYSQSYIVAASPGRRSAIVEAAGWCSGPRRSSVYRPGNR